MLRRNTAPAQSVPVSAVVRACRVTITACALFCALVVPAVESGEFIEDSFAILLTDDQPGGNFGAAVDISGDWALLSSPSHDSNRGKVNVYYFTGWNWTFSSAITAPNPIAGERFGHAVSIHEETAAVGVPLYNGKGHSDSGGVFMFYRAPRGEFQLQGILVPNITGPEWGCGQSVAVRDDYVVFGCPDEDEGGKAFLFQRVVATVDPVAAAAAGVPVDEFHHTWTQTAELHTPRVANGELFGWSVAIALSYNPSDMWAVKYDPHQLVDVETSNYTIVVGSPNDNGPERAAGSVTVFYNQYHGEYGCTKDTRCYLSRVTTEAAYLQTTDGTVNQQTGWAVKVDRGVVLAGAPQDSNDGIVLGGSAYIWRRQSETEWAMETKLRPADVATEDAYGYSLGLFGNASVVCAPEADPWETDSGKCYFYLFDGTIWEQATKVTALDHGSLEYFGRRVALDTGAVMGSGVANNFLGKVYHFGGYEFFPIPPPVFDPEPGSYLIPGPFELTAITGLPSEQVYYEFGVNNTTPVPFVSAHARNHKLTLPFSTQKAEIYISAMSANERLGRLFQSLPVTYFYTTWYPTPGYYWIDKELRECGGIEYYCPGTFTESVKVRVDLGRYTTPDLPDRLTTRAGQQWCEQNYYCVDGRRRTCGDDTCWPYPKRVVVAESLDPGLRAPGMSDGDRIIITFSTETNQPVNVTHPDLVSQLVQFNTPVADEMVGRWVNTSTLELTITRVPASFDLLDTRLDDSLTLSMPRMPGNDLLLRRINESTVTTDFPAEFLLVEGTWGDFVEPRLVEARAEYDPATPTQNSAHGPTLGDKLVLKFDQQVDTTIPANTRAEVDALIDIVPRINDIEYVGEWTGKDELTLTFVTEEQVTTYFTDHIRPPYGVGQLQVRMRADSVLRSRDRSSPYMRSQELVMVTGSWGDIPRDVFITLSAESALEVYFRLPVTNPLYNTSGFQMQVATDDGFTAIVHDTFMPSDVANHWHNEPYTHEFSVPPDTRYYVRVLAYNDETSTALGPFAVSRPPSLVVSRPYMVSLLSEDSVPTWGEPMTFRINDLGRGPSADPLALGLTARFNNGGTQHYASNCYLDWFDGSIMTCTPEAGTGTNYRWTFTAKGLRSFPSPFVTHYSPPVIYFFHRSSAGLHQALTNGSQPIILRGTNFGLKATSNVTFVKYWPNAFPNVIFTAQSCAVTRDHEEISCLTDVGAGADLRWLVRIADQDSAIISTDYDKPTIHHVGLQNPSNPNDPTELSSRGGEVIILSGINFGPIRDDVSPTVQYNLTDAPMGVPDSEIAEYGGTLFTAVGCEVTVVHTEIRCKSFPGFASRRPKWRVLMLGQTSDDFDGDLRYGLPTLLSLDSSTTATQAETNRIITGLHFAQLHALTHTQLLYRGEEVPRWRWETTDDTEIVFQVPPGTGAMNTVVLVVNGAHSNTLHLQYELPELDNVTLKWQEDDQLAMWQIHEAGESFPSDAITDLHRQSLEDRCLLLRLHGRNFGAVPEVVDITVGGVPCETITLRSHFLVECCSHERRGDIVVTVDHQASNALPYDIDDIIPVLRIDSVSPDHGPSIGSRLTLRGAEFQSGGGPMGWVRVTIPGHSDSSPVFCPIVSFEDDMVVCDQLPSDVRFTPTVDLTVEQYSYAAQRNVTSNAFTFAYDPPRIDDLYPLVVPQLGGVVSLTGSSFGSQGAVYLDTAVTGDLDPSLVLQRERCWPVLSWNHTHLACVAPKAAGNATLTVDVSWVETTIPHSHLAYRTPVPEPKLATSAGDARGAAVGSTAVVALVALAFAFNAMLGW